MKTAKLIFVILIFFTGVAIGQKRDRNLMIKGVTVEREPDRTISVTGSAEILVTPDEVHVQLDIQEYWKEEFMKRKDFKHYKTKVSMADIEPKIYKVLDSIGIPQTMIVQEGFINSERLTTKELLITKRITVKAKDFAQADAIGRLIDRKGISSIAVTRLVNHKIREYRRQVKIEAVKAARDKARDMVECIGFRLGPVLSIRERSQNDMFVTNHLSNTILPQNEPQTKASKKIHLSYRVDAKFDILVDDIDSQAKL
ncbi:SIMPL domain-containing protein [Fulvitalea axinellae]|uniref:SIMPL domain-containing protein n=1 Tax=Fulvitalea axinellae TaxID=1182444 RepID=A0AAU9C9I9_9BACT|nr:SIMPL domain-containing protein [Fulvitalea axinellae]